MACADVNGQQLYFEDTGGDGPPVIFSHGFLMDHVMLGRANPDPVDATIVAFLTDVAA
jgi:pimeloyl-ACP methyl ester carboxylesterase